ncbi:MAG TPA: histidine kinase dimerization/phosphoacceptor domain -containing protein [Spirochaetota bacterium]|nr:histidine kinase dimerization/phosphoacceptor domain -containing protein [Spirochaetota bacterium]
MEEERGNYIRYKLLLEKANDLIIVIQDNKIEFVNHGPLADLGYSADDVSYKSIFNYIHVDDRGKVLEFQRNKARNEGLPDDLVFRIVGKNGRLVFVKILSITSEWKGRPARLVCAKNITDRKLNELTVQQSEHLLFTIIDNLTDPTFVIDVNGKVFLWNKSLEAVSNVKSQDIVGKADFKSAVPFCGYEGPLLIDLMLKPDTEIQKEYDYFQRSENTLVAGRFLESTGGRCVRIWATSSILYDIQGDVIGAIESFRDMTDLIKTEETIKASIKEKEILLKEIHHRVKNNMQLINSMLRIQLQYVRDPESADLFKDSINRIATMALIHNDLYTYKEHSDINFSEFIPKLIDNLRATYGRQEITVLLESEEIHLGIDDAIPCGLILNELISNCLKHAFPKGTSGTVLVKIFLDAGTRLCNLVVRDDGKGLPSDFDLAKNTTSFGLLMVNLLTSQLRGAVRINYSNGTEFTISFPIKICEE